MNERDSDILKEGDVIHLLSRKGRRYQFQLKNGGRLHHSGEFIPHDEIIGKRDGTLIALSGGSRFIVLRPTLAEYILKMPRGAQIIYAKDIGVILTNADIYPGARILEAGIGSGAVTIALLRGVGEKGSVTSYEIREDFAEKATENIRRYLGEIQNHTLINKDIYNGIDDGPFDRIVLDLPEPWRVVPHAVDNIRGGGIFLCFLPTIIQTVTVVESLRETGCFTFINTIETLMRHWNIDGRSVRPEHRMVAHTGFITIARRVEKPLS